MGTIWFCAGTAGELIKLYPLLKKVNYDSCFQWRFLFSGQSPGNFLKQWRDFGLEEQALVALVESKNDLKTSLSAANWFFRAMTLSKSRITSACKTKFSLTPKAGDRWVVHGDTLSTLVGASWCRRMGGYLAHVEAGLRSTSLLRPFPEEINRRIVSRLARMHFAQDATAVSNLKRGGAIGEIILTNGNTLFDALDVLKTSCTQKDPQFPMRPFVVANIHRHENLTNPKKWRSIIKTLLYAQSKMQVYLVMHPPTEHKLFMEGEDRYLLENSGVTLLPRIAFSQFIMLIDQSAFVISDGGSNQEECAYLGKPCLIMREETERVEGLGRNCILAKFNWQVIKKFIDEYERYQLDSYPLIKSPSDIVLSYLFGNVVKTG